MKPIICPFCKKTVQFEELDTALRKVETWVRQGPKSVKQEIILPNYKEEWAHPHCINMAKRGVLGQGGLFDQSNENDCPF